MTTPRADVEIGERHGGFTVIGWHFAGATKRARWSQIGQAMPPPLAEAVARSIARALRGRSAA